MNEIKHECAISALYVLNKVDNHQPISIVDLMIQTLMEQQNRGQLAAGITSYDPARVDILKTYKNIGTVAEAFKISNTDFFAQLLRDYSGQAVIGHTRYATYGCDDIKYAQPFERISGKLNQWFAFSFNGNIANAKELKEQYQKVGYHFSLDSDTEIIMCIISNLLDINEAISLKDIMRELSKIIDGAYNIVYIDARGRMFVARDPLGIRPLNYAFQDGLFCAASESSALSLIGFDDISPLMPGHMIMIEDNEIKVEAYTETAKKASCFFEYVYFSNVTSSFDGINVYNCRAALGEILAERENIEIDDSCIVVPVPDTAKTIADAYAHCMHMRCVEGIARNRFIGRTFIQSPSMRKSAAERKYSPLKPVLEGKKIFLIDDSLVRSTTLKSLVKKLRVNGGVKEIHLRIACPPIIAPCFYGIALADYDELFAYEFIDSSYNGVVTEKMQKEMARILEVDSLIYLGVKDIPKAITEDENNLCMGCITDNYPTPYAKQFSSIIKNPPSKQNESV